MSDQLSLAGELRLALWTLEVAVLQPFGLLAGQRHERLGALRSAADGSGLTCRWRRGVLHRAGVGRDGGTPGCGSGRGDWGRGGRRGDEAWSAEGAKQKRDVVNEDASQMNDTRILAFIIKTTI